jgi:ATP/maltotriose-dependent transcriptional regulator MalT
LQKINPDMSVVHEMTHFLAFIRGDAAAMDREVEWAKGKPEEADFTSMRAAHAMYLGRAKQSEELAKRAVELLKQQNRQENASNVLINLAGNMAILGKCQPAKDYANAAMTLFRGDFGLSGAAMIYAACGDPGKAQAMIDAARTSAPKNTFVTSIVAPMIRAEIERQRGNTAEALQLLESLRSYDFGQDTGLTNMYLRGALYLQQRRGNEAAAEFKKIIESRGIEAFSPFHALAHVGLARAAAMNGDMAGARKAYQDFFAMWKDADADLPVLVEARKEYAQLK